MVDKHIQKGYENLANSIILQAIRDYRIALRVLHKYPNDRAAQYQVKDIERFFRSEWFSVLSAVCPERIIQKLRQEDMTKKPYTKNVV